MSEEETTTFGTGGSVTGATDHDSDADDERSYDTGDELTTDEDDDEERELTDRQKAGLVEEDFKQLPNDETLAAGEHLNDEILNNPNPSPAVFSPSRFGNPYMSEEEQGMEMQSQVMGPPQYGSPDPTTAAGRLLPLTGHPLRPDVLPEGTAAAISADYGQDVAGYVHGPTDSSHAITPPPSDLELDAAGLRDSREGNYEEMSKTQLLDEARRRGLDVNTGTKKDELVSALEADDEASSDNE